MNLKTRTAGEGQNCCINDSEAKARKNKIETGCDRSMCWEYKNLIEVYMKFTWGDRKVLEGGKVQFSRFQLYNAKHLDICTHFGL